MEIAWLAGHPHIRLYQKARRYDAEILQIGHVLQGNRAQKGKNVLEPTVAHESVIKEPDVEILPVGILRYIQVPAPASKKGGAIRKTKKFIISAPRTKFSWSDFASASQI